MRLDKYLKVSRLIKRRTVANEACDNERVSLRRQARRPDQHPLRPEDAGRGGAVRAGQRRQGGRRRDVPRDSGGRPVIIAALLSYHTGKTVWRRGAFFYAV